MSIVMIVISVFTEAQECAVLSSSLHGVLFWQSGYLQH